MLCVYPTLPPPPSFPPSPLPHPSSHPSYDALLQEKEALEEEVESLQTQLQTVREEKSGKQQRMLQKVVRNLEVCRTQCEVYMQDTA